MSVCSKCSGAMQEGEIIVWANISEPQVSPTSGLLGMPGMNLGVVETSKEEKMQWREKTGQKRGVSKK